MQPQTTSDMEVDECLQIVPYNGCLYYFARASCDREWFWWKAEGPMEDTNKMRKDRGVIHDLMNAYNDLHGFAGISLKEFITAAIKQ
jgi:hypothetical protein